MYKIHHRRPESLHQGSQARRGLSNSGVEGRLWGAVPRSGPGGQHRVDGRGAIKGPHECPEPEVQRGVLRGHPSGLDRPGGEFRAGQAGGDCERYDNTNV